MSRLCKYIGRANAKPRRVPTVSGMLPVVLMVFKWVEFCRTESKFKIYMYTVYIYIYILISGGDVPIRRFQPCARHVSAFCRRLVFSLRRYCTSLRFCVEPSLQIELCLASSDNNDRKFVSSLWPWYPRVDILCALLQCQHFRMCCIEVCCG